MTWFLNFKQALRACLKFKKGDENKQNVIVRRNDKAKRSMQRKATFCFASQVFSQSRSQ